MTQKPITPHHQFVPMIGQPIGQVITPEPMNRYFQAHDIEAAIVPVDLAREQVGNFFAMVRGWGNCAGVSVTMPHKQAAFAFSDTHSERAKQAGAANLIIRHTDGSLHGDMTDGAAFVSAVRTKGFEPQTKHFVLIGAGGAGAAVAHAMAQAHIAVIHIIEVDAARRTALANALAKHYPDVAVRSDLKTDDTVDIVFNATPLGMQSVDALPLDVTRLPQHCFVADAVTKPVVTPFLEAARARGLATLTGEEMALAQLPIQLPLWGFGPYGEPNGKR